MSQAVKTRATLPDAPFRGIESLRFVDQAIFATRDKDTWTLVSKITLYHAVVLYGQSGSGKSSLINAGVLPRVLSDGYVVDRIRVQPFEGREIKIERLRRSDDERDGYLASSFVSAPDEAGLAVDQSAGFELSLLEFREQLRRLRGWKQVTDEKTGLPAVRPNSSPRRALLVFDQFEELITLFDEAQRQLSNTGDNRGQACTNRTRRRILVTLVKLIRDKTLPIKMILAFREDYLAKLSILFDHCPELLNQGQRLLPPRKEVLPTIIRAPFEREDLKAHFLLAGEARSEISKELAKRITEELAERADSDMPNLTELQIVCRRLWQSSNPEELFEDKGIQGLLREYGRDVFRAFPDELQEAAVALLSRMVTASNTRNIVSEDDLVERTSSHEHIPREKLVRTLNLLANTRIVRQESRRNLHVYEITSEYLVPWIQERVAERKAFAFRRVAKERRWRLAAQRRQTRLFQRLVLALVVLVLGLVTLGIFIVYQNKQVAEARKEQVLSQQQQHASEAARQDAQKQQERYRAAINVITGNNDEEKLKAIAQISEWTREKDFPSNLTLLLVVAQSRTDSQRVKQALSRVLGQAVEADANLSQSIDAAARANEGLAEKLPPRFYVQIPNESQRPMAQKVAVALNEQGWVVPSIQPVSGGRFFWDNELRYYRKSEPNAPPLEDILSLLEKVTGSKWQPHYVPNFEDSTKIRPGHFEISFATPPGKLFVSLVDEADNPLKNLKVTLRFVPRESTGVNFSRSRPGPGFIDVVPGNYDVTIKAKGYKALSLFLSIDTGEPTYWSNLKLTRE